MRHGSTTAPIRAAIPQSHPTPQKQQRLIMAAGQARVYDHPARPVEDSARAINGMACGIDLYQRHNQKE
jgi:hypothetical protein